MSHQWLRLIREVAEEVGGEVKRTRSGHFAIHLPNGVKVYTAGTPSNPAREAKNTRAAIRRAMKHGRVK